MKQITIDMAGLPDELAADLEKQILAIVEKAKADLPISFDQRVELALAELPYEDVKNIQLGMLVSSLKSQLQQHFDKLGFVQVVSEKAVACTNWIDEEFGDAEFEHQVSELLESFFI